MEIIVFLFMDIINVKHLQGVTLKCQHLFGVIYNEEFNRMV
jgi:hypothetical protein